MVNLKEKDKLSRVNSSVNMKKTLHRKEKHTQKKGYLIIILFVTAILISIGVAVYFVFQFRASEEIREGFFVCNQDKTICELSTHTHAEIEVKICGQNISFPKEKGNTDMQHTHKEENKIHWESRTKVDPVTKESLDPSIFAIDNFLEQMEFTLPKSCPQNPTPVLLVYINGALKPEKLQASWKDGDNILLTYE